MKQLIRQLKVYLKLCHRKHKELYHGYARIFIFTFMCIILPSSIALTSFLILAIIILLTIIIVNSK